MRKEDQRRNYKNDAVLRIENTEVSEEKALKRFGKIRKFKFEYITLTPKNIILITVLICLIFLFTPDEHYRPFPLKGSLDKGLTVGKIYSGRIIFVDGKPVSLTGNREIEKVYNTKCRNIFAVVNGWVYYADSGPMGRGIFKEKGGREIKLADCDYITRAIYYDKWIYYSQGPESGTDYSIKAGLYKVDSDGKNKKQLTEQLVNDMEIRDGWIYYGGTTSATKKVGDTIVEESENQGIFKMKTDGSRLSKVCEDPPQFLDVSGSNIYYSNFSDNRKLYKISINGFHRQKLSDDERCFDIFVDGSWVYYASDAYDGHTFMPSPLDNTKGNIYRIDINGIKKTRLNDQPSRITSIYDGWIYYNNLQDGKVYKMKLNGGDNTFIQDLFSS